MKSYFSLTLLALVAVGLTSCCSLGIGRNCADKNSAANCGEYIKTTVTQFEEISHPSSKGQTYTTTELVTKEVNVPVTCPECVTKYKPCEKCCGGVGNEVIRRASAIGWNGNPHIGLIPTMKVLAE